MALPEPLPKDVDWNSDPGITDDPSVSFSSNTTPAVSKPAVTEKKFACIIYSAGDTFQIGKNGDSIFNRIVPTGKKMEIYVRARITDE